MALWDLPLHHLHFNLRAARGGVRPGGCRHCLGVVLVVRQRDLSQELGPLVLSPWRECGLMDLGRVVGSWWRRLLESHLLCSLFLVK